MSEINLFDSAAAFAQLEKELTLAGSYDRLPLLLKYADSCVSSDWLGELGRLWTVCDNIGVYSVELVCAVLSHHWDDSPIKPMMDEAELQAFDELPEVLTIYRGCYEVNKWGFSWSLDRAIAERFPFLNRYRGEGRPLLVKATIHKSRIAAVKLDRSEAEIVTFNRPKCLAIYTAKYRAAVAEGGAA